MGLLFQLKSLEFLVRNFCGQKPFFYKPIMNIAASTRNTSNIIKGVKKFVLIDRPYS